jgi:CRP-like cAMP-binding protein
MEWLQPFMDSTAIKKGEVLVRKGDKADCMFYVLDGKLCVCDIDTVLGEGAVVGELGMLSPGQLRTHTVTCIEDARLLVMPYSRIEQLYYQNPAFGFYFLKLSSARLFENIAHLEQLLASSRSEIDRLKAAQRPPQRPLSGASLSSGSRTRA